MQERKVSGVHRYDAPARGWGALRATANAVAEQMHVVEAPTLLLRMNKTASTARAVLGRTKSTRHFPVLRERREAPLEPTLSTSATVRRAQKGLCDGSACTSAQRRVSTTDSMSRRKIDGAVKSVQPLSSRITTRRWVGKTNPSNVLWSNV
jgi:hypothetical protein